MQELNRWQKIYVDHNFGGKMPRGKHEKRVVGLLGQVRGNIKVHVLKGPGWDEHDVTYVVSADYDDFPNGIISVAGLAANLPLWLDRGYTIATF